MLLSMPICDASGSCFCENSSSPNYIICLYQLLNYDNFLNHFQLLEKVLGASGNDLDSAIKSLNKLRLGCDDSNNPLEIFSQPSAEGSSFVICLCRYMFIPSILYLEFENKWIFRAHHRCMFVFI